MLMPGPGTLRGVVVDDRIEVKRERTLLAERRSEAPLQGPVEVDIVIDEHLKVRGKLVDEQGKPVAGWRVVAIQDSASESDLMRALAFAFDADTKQDGSFEIWGELRQSLQVAARDSGIAARGTGSQRSGGAPRRRFITAAVGPTSTTAS